MSRKLLILLVLPALIAGLGLTNSVAAQDAGVDGSMVGDRGGAYETWEVTLPEDTDVTLTLTHYPCTNNDAISLDVWSPSAMLADSNKIGACTEVAHFNTGSGGSATIRLNNYLHNVGTWYNLQAEGISLPGAAAAPAEEPAMDDEAATESDMDEAAETDAATAETAADDMTTDMTTETEAAEAPADVAGSGGALFGGPAGAFATHALAVTEGTEYTLTLDYSVDGGGNWSGVGFDVWGPSGLVASSNDVDFNTESATFTAEMDGTYIVNVYNYHPRNAWYSLVSSTGTITAADDTAGETSN